MKIYFSIAAFLLLSCSTKKTGDQIDGGCMLLEFSNEKASCGIYSVWVGMKFKEVKSNLIFVGLVHCPDNYTGREPDFFKAGKIYKIVAKRPLDIRQSDFIINEYDSSGLIVYRIDELMKK